METGGIIWRELVTRSHYQTAVAIQQRLQNGDTEEALQGIQELAEALSRSDRRALRSQLIRLLSHVIKWKAQPARRSPSWVATIEHARMEIAELLEEEPSLVRLLPELFTQLEDRARKLAESEMNQTSTGISLSWEDVFDTSYRIGNDGETDGTSRH